MARESNVVIFGPFEADLTTGELQRSGQPLHLQHQPFELLVALLERPGELVSQEELRRRVWPDGTHVSFERGLASAMRKLREALGDSAKSPVYIETLQRRGYRFIAPVWRHAPSPRPEPVERRASSPYSSAKVRWAAVVLLAVLIGGQGRFPAGTDERVLAAESLSAYACALKSRGNLARREDFGKAIESLERARQLAGADKSVEYWLALARDQRSRTTVGS